MKNLTTFIYLLLFPLSLSYASDFQFLLENEKNTISVFKNNVNSVVNVSNIRLARTSFWNFESVEVPAGAGTGFVWDNNGHIVTNYHVIAGGDSFHITFHKDKKQYQAKVVGVEPRRDIAVLKVINPPTNAKPVLIGNSKDIHVGQKTLAIGNPFGFDHTITTGIISALGRKIEGIGEVEIPDMIQTDASINPGNSGGPLLNSGGQLIGMNTQIISRTGTSSGVGFAVPVDIIKRVVPQLIKHGKVIQPGFGIAIFQDREKEYYGIETKGVVIKYITERNGPAAKAGLKGMHRDRFGRPHLGDAIIAIEDKEINSYSDLYNALENYKVGDTISVKYIRDNKKKTARVTLSRVN